MVAVQRCVCIRVVHRPLYPTSTERSPMNPWPCRLRKGLCFNVSCRRHWMIYRLPFNSTLASLLPTSTEVCLVFRPDEGKKENRQFA